MTKIEAKLAAKQLMTRLKNEGDTLGIGQIREYLDAKYPQLRGRDRELAEEAICRAIVELA